MESDLLDYQNKEGEPVPSLKHFGQTFVISRETVALVFIDSLRVMADDAPKQLKLLNTKPKDSAQLLARFEFIGRYVSADAIKLIGFGFVWPPVGAKIWSAGISGVSPEVDVRALQEMVGWLCATLGQPALSRLEVVFREV